MNKPVVAAVTGLVFGSILCLSAYRYVSHRSHSSCCQWGAGSALAGPVVAPPSAPPAVLAAPRVAQPRATDCVEDARTLSIAQTAFVDGDYAESMRIARMCIPQSPVRAWRIIGGAGCRLHDRDAVQEAYRHLDATGRQYMAYACQRSGFPVR